MAEEKKIYSALIIEEDTEVAQFLARMLKIINVESTISHDLQSAKRVLKSKPIDILIVDYFLPDGTGSDFLESLNKENKNFPSIMISDEPGSMKLPSLVAGANVVLTKPFSDAELLMVTRNLLKVSEIYDKLEYAEQVIEALVATVEARDYYTSGHSTRVSKYSVKMFETLGFNDKKEKEDLRVGGLLHDIGKIGVPDKILKSKGALSDEDFEEIKKHPLTGYEICKSLDRLQGSLPVIAQHHERLDGSGYPYGLKDGEISRLAQITMIPDIYDALTTKRTYREAMSCAQAIRLLEKDAADGKINEVYLAVFKNDVLNNVLMKENLFGCTDEGLI